MEPHLKFASSFNDLEEEKKCMKKKQQKRLTSHVLSALVVQIYTATILLSFSNFQLPLPFYSGCTILTPPLTISLRFQFSSFHNSLAAQQNKYIIKDLSYYIEDAPPCYTYTTYMALQQRRQSKRYTGLRFNHKWKKGWEIVGNFRKRISL